MTSTSTPGSKLILVCEHTHRTSGERRVKENKNTHDLLDNLARRVEVNEALVDFEFVAIPGLGSLTARLEKRGR